MPYLLAVLGIALGLTAVVAGEVDDSPGLGGLGLLLAIGAATYAVRRARRRRSPAGSR